MLQVIRRAPPWMEKGLPRRGLHPAGDHRGVVGLVELARDHDEVVLAEVGGEVAGAQRLADAPGGEAQHLVAGALAERLAQDLEAVEVDAEHRGLAAERGRRRRPAARGGRGSRRRWACRSARRAAGGSGSRGLPRRSAPPRRRCGGGPAAPRRRRRRRRRRSWSASEPRRIEAARAGGDLDGGAAARAAMRSSCGRMRLSKRACSAAAAAPRGAGLAAAATAAIAPSRRGEAGGERDAGGVEREEAVDVPGEAGFGGGVRLALRQGGEPLEGDDDGAGAGRLGGGDHGAARRCGPGASWARSSTTCAASTIARPTPSASAGRPREEAVGGGAGRELGFAGHGAGR